MTDTDTRWAAPLTLLQRPMAMVRQELSEGKRYNRNPIEIAGRLLGADIGITKRETGVEVSWLTKERDGTQMGLRLRQGPAGAAIEARGPGYKYQMPPQMELKPAFRVPDNDHATLAASMGTLFDIANDNAWRPTMLDYYAIDERVRLGDHARALRRALANWLSLNPDEAMVSPKAREHALNDLQRRINIVRGRGRVQLSGDPPYQPASIDI